jgi:hypothetical protein
MRKIDALREKQSLNESAFSKVGSLSLSALSEPHFKTLGFR